MKHDDIRTQSPQKDHDDDAAHPGTVQTIMVIGEDLHFCYLIRRYVRAMHHQFLLARPDTKALQTAVREQPAVIIFDVGISDGLVQRMLRQMKEDVQTCKIPLVVCSWHENRLLATADGADQYLRMPILFGDFVATVASLGIVPG